MNYCKLCQPRNASTFVGRKLLALYTQSGLVNLIYIPKYMQEIRGRCLCTMHPCFEWCEIQKNLLFQCQQRRHLGQIHKVTCMHVLSISFCLGLVSAKPSLADHGPRRAKTGLFPPGKEVVVSAPIQPSYICSKRTGYCTLLCIPPLWTLYFA